MLTRFAECTDSEIYLGICGLVFEIKSIKNSKINQTSHLPKQVPLFTIVEFPDAALGKDQNQFFEKPAAAVLWP